MSAYTIYSDGAYSPTRDQGGVGFVILKEDKKIFTFKKMFVHTTNQRMELLAVCIALESIRDPGDIKIISDSAYLVNTIIKGWKRNANLDLWERLDNAINRHLNVRFEWTKGHALDSYNNEADELAVEASQQIKSYGRG